METTASFSDYLATLIQQRQYVKVQYFTEFHELVTLHALVVRLAGEGDTLTVTLSSGEVIPMNKFVSAGGQFAPTYDGYAPYCETCDC
jgi:Rho-binding antiterminator